MRIAIRPGRAVWSVLLLSALVGVLALGWAGAAAAAPVTYTLRFSNNAATVNGAPNTNSGSGATVTVTSNGATYGRTLFGTAGGNNTTIWSFPNAFTGSVLMGWALTPTNFAADTWIAANATATIGLRNSGAGAWRFELLDIDNAANPATFTVIATASPAVATNTNSFAQSVAWTNAAYKLGAGHRLGVRVYVDNPTGSTHSVVFNNTGSNLARVIVDETPAAVPPTATTWYLVSSSGATVGTGLSTTNSPNGDLTIVNGSVYGRTIMAQANGTTRVRWIFDNTAVSGDVLMGWAFLPYNYALPTTIAANTTATIGVRNGGGTWRFELIDLDNATNPATFNVIASTTNATNTGATTTAIPVSWAHAAYLLGAGHRLGIRVYISNPTNSSHRVYFNNASAERSSIAVKAHASPTAPMTGISFSGGALGDNGWYQTAAPLVTLTADQIGASTYYRWDDDSAPYTTYTGSFVALEGQHTLYYYSTSGGLEETPHKSQALKVDASLPISVLTTPSGPDASAPAVVGGPAVSLQATATDAVSGVRFVAFYFHGWNGSGYDSVGTQIGGDQGPDPPYEVNWDTTLAPVVSGNKYQLEAVTRDNAGNFVSSAYQYVLVDNTAPVATLSTPPADTSISGSTYAVTGGATDANLSSWSVEKRRLPDASFSPVASGTSPVSAGNFATIDTTDGTYPDGTYEFKLTVADTAGNVITDLHSGVTVDNTRPSVSSATSMGRNWVNVVFSEPIDPANLDATYFEIPGLTVTGVAPQVDPSTVQLTTSDQTAGTNNYSVTVKDTAPTVTDLADNVVGVPNVAGFSGTTTLSAPAAPTGVQALSGNGQNEVSWAANTEDFLGGYNVYRDTSAGGGFTTKVNATLVPAGTTTLVDTAYGTAGAYYYKVTAVNATGGESAKSAAVAADLVHMSATVGAAGATLTSSTGEARLVIPAGALGADTPIQVTESVKPADLPTLEFFSPAYDLQPTGQSFAADVTLTLRQNPTVPGPSELDAKLYYYDLGNTKWVAAEGGSTVDTAAHTVAGSMDHFTEFAVGLFSAVPPAVVSVDPADTATGVAVTSRVAITFSLPMDPNAADWTRFQIRRAGTPITIGSPVLSADHRTVYLYPSQMMDINTAYTVFVSTTALGENGAAVGTDFTSAFTTSATGVSPHEAYSSATDLCASCHAVHGAAVASTGGGRLFTEPTEKLVCYTCHDGTGSAYDVQTGTKGTSHAWDFGEEVPDTTVKASYHTVPKASDLGGSATMQCSNCHSAHGIDTSGQRLLVVKRMDDPTLQGPTKVAWGADKNEYCFTCHTAASDAAAYAALPPTSKYIGNEIWGSSTGFDHKTSYSAAGSGHNNPAGLGFTSASQWVPSVAGIVCKGCHSEHGTTNSKLISEKVNNVDVTFDSADATGYNTTYNPFCETCHQGAGVGGSYWPTATTYDDSGHGSSTQTRTLSYLPNDASASMALQVKLCKQCHEPHGAGVAGEPNLNLTRYFEEGVCYTCHSGSAGSPADAKNVASVFASSQKHDLGLSATGAVKHDQEAEYDANLNPNPRLSGGNRHVECTDCHNMHESDDSPRLAGTNLRSGSLKGVWGVDASAGVTWSESSGWTWVKVDPITAEYQLCLKCHSAAAYGSPASGGGPPARAQILTPGTSFWPITTYTDQAVEFNPNNPSYHAVWGGSKASAYGTYVTAAGWSATSSMYCSDCHRPDTATTPSVSGAHASNTPFMLGGYTTPSSARYVTGHGDVEYTDQAARDNDFALCFECHDPRGSSSGFSEGGNNLHNLEEHTLRACTVCHVAVPHGAPRPRLVVLDSDPAPYNDGSARITSIAFSSDRSYDKGSCATSGDCHN